jgi:4-diphosphocytidyl-2-C-methyl-D-erythritol kinase
MSEQFTKINGGLLVRAPGKINLSLLVKGKRPDGYHDIESIMAKIDWYDEILIERQTEDRGQRTEDGRQNIEHPTSNAEHRTNEKPIIELICKGEYKVPEGEENLVYKAARIILETARQKTEDEISNPKNEIPNKSQLTKIQITNKEQRMQNAECRTEGIRITLTKHIPVGSGLGSGSSDAAATLMGINKFLRMGLGQKELVRLATELGSDVAFFLDGPMALCTGRGEKVKKLEECEFRVFLVVPDISVSTKRVYENYRHDEAKYRRLSEEINIYIEKKRIDLICGLCANMLQESCFEMHPELGVLKKKIESLGIRPVGLSGSGSSMFCIINNRNEEAVDNRDKLEQELGCKSYIVNNNSW